MTAQALWLDDIRVGDRFRSGSHTVTAAEIVSFAESYDPQPFHLGESLAAGTFFAGLAASGWHTAAITMRLLVDGGLPIAHGIIGVEQQLAWPTPTRPGDVLHVESVVTEVKVGRSDPARGIVTTEYLTINQEGEVRQRATGKILVFRKPE
ncbi:MaoC family dehydratase [Nocardia sp. NPDC059239]|uniref:MaoC family dehydratase n=1 Tax=unclassified Nocardia TaxID=2637762 RepID=UPI0036C42184